MSFGDFFKSVFSSKKQQIFKTYTASQLKIIAMKARITLQQHYKKCVHLIQANDSILFQKQNNPQESYIVFMEIGKLVIQVESMRIYAEMLKKIQDSAARIINTNGDIKLLKNQLNWIKCLLWYRKCKKQKAIDDFHTFCFNFFKGVDMVSEVTLKCEIFQIYPVTRYIDPHSAVPLKFLYPKIQQYLNTRVNEQVLDQILKKNKEECKKWVERNQIQQKDRYISKQKSPIKQKKVSPFKNVESKIKQANHQLRQNQSKKQSVQTSQYNKWIQSLSKLSQSKEENNQQKKHIVSSQKVQQVIPSTLTKFQDVDQNNDSNFKPTKSLMKKFMQSSSNQSTEQNYICQSCGNSFKSLLSQNLKLKCQTCEMFEEDISQQTNIQENSHENFKKKGPQTQTFGETQKQNEILLKQNSEKQGQNKEIFKQEPVQNKQFTQEPINLNSFEDEQDSLQFIRQSVTLKKKPTKKPYMVSIYARAEYMKKVQDAQKKSPIF